MDSKGKKDSNEQQILAAVLYKSGRSYKKPGLEPVENPEPVKPERLQPNLVINQIIHSSCLLPFQQTFLLPSSPSGQLGDTSDEEPMAKE